MHAVVDEVGDPVGEHAGLAGACAGDHEERSGLVGDGVELVGVQSLGERRRAAIADRIGRRAVGGMRSAREYSAASFANSSSSVMCDPL